MNLYMIFQRPRTQGWSDWWVRQRGTKEGSGKLKLCHPIAGIRVAQHKIPQPYAQGSAHGNELDDHGKTPFTVVSLPASANPGSAKLASWCCDAINSGTHSSQCCNQGDPFYTDKSGSADVNKKVSDCSKPGGMSEGRSRSRNTSKTVTFLIFFIVFVIIIVLIDLIIIIIFTQYAGIADQWGSTSAESVKTH